MNRDAEWHPIQVDFRPPAWQMAAEKDYRPIRPYDAPLKMDDVRLVHSVTDPKTGETREVIVDSMEARRRIVVGTEDNSVRVQAGKSLPIYEDGKVVAYTEAKDHAYRLRGYKQETVRIIPGLETEIVKVVDERALEDEAYEEPYYDDDTLLITVEEETFVPPLTTTPMPGSVIDELRSKYSKLRTRHDDEYLEARAEKDIEKEVVMEKRERLMRTPQQELRERRDALIKEEVEKRELSGNALLKIGKAMAKKLPPKALQRRLDETVA
jgi:large subunit ribosomal protein L24